MTIIKIKLLYCKQFIKIIKNKNARMNLKLIQKKPHIIST